ncbi:MAG TPA: hypothetical protein GXZ76_04345 [Clostridiaceae bacterium]|nr:hypothetical protein [Clostridiaceae bacterium]
MYRIKQKSIAIITCVAVIIVALFSMLFIFKEAEHECTGEDCFICACIKHTAQALNQLSAGWDIGQTIAVPHVFLVLISTLPVFLLVSCLSLIRQKVRLNE